MRGSTHVLFGALIALLLIRFGMPSEYAVLVILYSLLPDIDVKGSLAYSLFIGISFIASRIPHRGPIHTPVAGFLFSLPLYYLSPRAFIAGYLGYLGHLFLDSMNPKGVQRLRPVKKKYYRFARIRVGSFQEELLSRSLAGLIMFLLFTLYLPL